MNYLARRSSHLFGKALRETGQAFDRVGILTSQTDFYKETFSRNRPVMPLFDKVPKVESTVFVAPGATVIGDVQIDKNTSIWYGVVVRGDNNKIKIGKYTNIQDRAVVNISVEKNEAFSSEVKIGSYVTVGHGALLNSCVVEDHVLIGQGAIIQQGAVIMKNSMVAAGAVILPGTIVPEGQLWGGNPAVFMRDLTVDDIAALEKSATHYAKLSQEHAVSFSTSS
mmetsp:Transcript_16631/g.15989  ORF Transcript_16631/g.15989 Transcript_16631/m.15989 type:complete len:224 (-) Transcript_16631:401-1072(-)|eukprot:CAMPEP_0119033444 /NCGR_PEP_ID=MMETSP1177-20130426/480_1 /TAXON_ID=2985 /ORGANISM="Ochromonas sp, Strain CCMP1899" /LENGTH=223 /DNA_ID=CAMNT_0006990181 /DNA_START=104 /DNA_END=775 /DNA_ORIENTATION=+